MSVCKRPKKGDEESMKYTANESFRSFCSSRLLRHMSQIQLLDRIAAFNGD